MKIIFGADHGGYELKENLKKYLEDKKIECEDVGCFSTESTDYPIYAKKVAEAIQQKKADFGILCCSTGIGMMLCANRFEGVRAACCQDAYSAELTRRHNAANILCLGGKLVSAKEACELVDIFLSTPFEGGRHTRRIEMYDKLN